MKDSLDKQKGKLTALMDSVKGAGDIPKEMLANMKAKLEELKAKKQQQPEPEPDYYAPPAYGSAPPAPPAYGPAPPAPPAYGPAPPAYGPAPPAPPAYGPAPPAPTAYGYSADIPQFPSVPVPVPVAGYQAEPIIPLPPAVSYDSQPAPSYGK